MRIEPSQHWSDYWARGCVTSLPQDFAANYDGEIGNFWRTQFQRVPEDGQVLDLCTGNGAVILLAAEFARSANRHLGLTAVDAAAIDNPAMAAKHPELAPLLSRIEFCGGQRVEDMAFPDSRFDLITSQYGVEYCRWPAAAAQVERLLKPGGFFAMVSHAVDSDILRYMEKENEQYELLEKSDLLTMTGKYLDGDLSFALLQQNLSQTGQRIKASLALSPSPFLTMVLNTLGQILAMDETMLRRQRDNLRRFRRDLVSGFDRLKDMLGVNQAIAADADWTRVFVAAGLEARDCGDLFHSGNHHAGVYYLFAKPKS